MPRQRYVSKELTHFVGRMLPSDDDRYNALVNVLRSGELRPAGRPDVSLLASVTVDPSRPLCENEMFSPDVICFCDIPVDDFHLHMEKYGKFGVAFRKSFLVRCGASPVFYVETESRVSRVRRFSSEEERTAAIEAAAGDINKLVEASTRGLEFNDAVRKYVEHFRRRKRWMTPSTAKEIREYFMEEDRVAFFFFSYLFAFVKCWNSSRDESDRENFYMEREWRIPGGVKFKLTDVSRIILPEVYAERFGADLPDYSSQLTFAE